MTHSVTVMASNFRRTSEQTNKSAVINNSRIKMLSRLKIIACLLVVYVSTRSQPARCQMGWSSSQNSGGHYDPEQQDGIPVLSARTLRPRPADDWLNYDEEQNRQRQQQQQEKLDHLRRIQAQRRNSDGDLDDGIEDDDDDEYKSGSSNHDSSIEPAYGESQRAAQDGDEIERFFDNNIGPEDVGAASNQHEASTNEVPIHTIPGLRSTQDPDDDMYEAAASSPLVTLFQSLLGGPDRKPFVIHATTTSGGGAGSSNDEPDSTGDKTNVNNVYNNPAGQATSLISSSDSSLRAASLTADHYAQPVAPIAAFLSPIISSANPMGSSTNEDQTTTTSTNDQSPVQEIYIGRRPSIVKLLQQQQQQQQAASLYQAAPPQMMVPMSQAGSAQVWRGSPGPGAGMDYQQQLQQQDDPNSEYMMRAPPMAASYAHQSAGGGGVEPNQPTAENDDQQTVTYGLSFGGASSLDSGSDDDQSQQHQPDDHQSSNYDEQQQQQPGYMPYNERDLLRYKTSSSRNYNQNGGRYGTAPVAYIRVPNQGYMMQQQQQPYHGSRYHKDPTEMAQMVAGQNPMMRPNDQYRLQQQHRRYRDPDDKAAASMERQQLLASLDKQIRASPYYRNNNNNNSYRQPISRRPDSNGSGGQAAVDDATATAASGSMIRGEPQIDSDLDTFDSYHSEVDPYKTFTATSRMIKYPASSHHLESGTTRVPANADPSESSKQNGNPANQSPMDQPVEGSRGPRLATGPLINYDNNNNNEQLAAIHQGGPHTDHRMDLLRTNRLGQQPLGDQLATKQHDDLKRAHANLRVRRDDSEDRSDDVDDDDGGVWVDDDDDDDNRQQSSDVNETSQDPEEDGDGGDDGDGGQEEQDGAYNNNRATQLSPPGMVGTPHGYELSPNDLMIYPGR